MHFPDIYGLEKFIYNGKVYPVGTPVVRVDSRGLRFGDGFFETMKIRKGRIILETPHMERLFTSLEQLGFAIPKDFTAARLRDMILELAGRNNHLGHGRVRLTITRSEGGLYDAHHQRPCYSIETFALEDAMLSLNEHGWVAGICQDVQKAADRFSLIKSNSALPYVLAAQQAQLHKWNDAILVNASGRIADSSIANVFIISNGVVKTPALKEGCVAGVMRRHLLGELRKQAIPVEETSITTDELLQSSEVFLTNAVRGIRWVQAVNDSRYTTAAAPRFFNEFIKPLWS